MNNFIIGSGWFSDTIGISELGQISNSHQNKYGGTHSRNEKFSKYWLSSILNQSILPKRIYILDADSPEKINDYVKNHTLVDISEQTQNFGHGVYCSKKNILCGWARGFVYGAVQAYLNDCDFVYVEQDLLIFGEKFIENIFKLLEKNNKQVCYLTGEETPQKLQQSFVVAKYSYLPKLISGLINSSDNKISEELKHYNLIKNDVMWCPYKGGRQRKNLNSEFFCLQHMDENEIDYYVSNGKIKRDL